MILFLQKKICDLQTDIVNECSFYFKVENVFKTLNGYSNCDCHLTLLLMTSQITGVPVLSTSISGAFLVTQYSARAKVTFDCRHRYIQAQKTIR